MPNVKAWTTFAIGLRQAGLRILAEANLKETGDGKTELRIAGLLLLSRTLSNLKGALILLDKEQIVEARTLVRCCYENHLWVSGLVKSGQKFKDEMIGNEMKHKRIGVQSLFRSRTELDEARMGRMRQWMRDTEHWDDSGTLNPGGVAKNTADQSYIFYQNLSLDAHPSIHTLNRYFSEAESGDGSPTITIEPEVSESEIIETLNLLCLPVLGVFLGASVLLGHEETPLELGKLAEEYKSLTELTGQS